MRKISTDAYVDYWNNIHLTTPCDLAAVCFPNKPLYFNLFFDRTQKHAISKYLKKEGIRLEGKKMLDIGCGRGRWLAFFRKKYGAIVAGTDLSKRAVRACESKGFHACQASITEMPFRESFFDFVNSTTVLMHLPHRIKEKAIAEISRVLKPSGKAILIEATWKDPSPHVYGLNILEWEKHFNKFDMNMVHKSGHCFILFQTKLPSYLPCRDFFTIHLDYPLEYGLMNYFYGRQSEVALQHLMVFEK